MLKNVAEVARYLTDEVAAGELSQNLRWPEGVRCPFCDHATVYETTGANETRKQWKCASCREKFSVTSRSIFEGSHIPLGKWIYAIFMMCSSKKGISANQLKRELGLAYRSAWFLCQRIRYAMEREPLAAMLGTNQGVVELDETFIGGKKKNNRHAKKPGSKAGRKIAVMTLIDREGDVKTVKVPNVKKGTLQTLAKPIVDKSATIITDAHLSYEGLDQHFGAHFTVDHSKEFVRGVIFHTNFAESYHSLLKRGIIGTFHHLSEKHLDRYLSEFDFRWNTRKISDGERTAKAIQAAPGKRLMYRSPTRG